MTTKATIWLATVAVVGLTACGGGEGSDDGVASLDDGATESADEGDADRPGEPEPGEAEDAFVEVAQCMRDQGIDAPDLVDDETIASPHPEIEAEHPGYKEAYDVCIPILEEVTGSFEMSPEETVEMQDDLLAVARCMRERGYDYPDPQFGDDGMVIPGESGQLDVSVEQYEHDLNDCAAEMSRTEEE